jgi:exodeoxyribonuclease VII large subunit
MSEKLTLTELQLIIRDSLYLSLPQMFWVTAEISEITVNSSGHCYLELVEKNNDEKNLRARIRGIIWNNRFGFIKSFFENITGETLKTGLKILVRARVEYHELYGLSLVISDIDPAFTLGEMAVKRQLIIKRLEEEGVFTMNRDLEFPVCPQRIAVISSANAAGYTDFIKQIRENSYGYVFYTALIETPMQGTETEQGVVSALDRIANNYELFDAVVIIRGGGSQTDLSWFDSYDIAYHITQFPLPVITGIGHEKNISVTDMVANQSLKTPTAVADFLIDSLAAAENELNELATGIRDASGEILDENQAIIEAFSVKLHPLARIMISANRERLSGKVMELTRLSREIMAGKSIFVSNLSHRMFSSAKNSVSDRMKSLDVSSQNLQVSARNMMSLTNAKLSGLENSLSILDPENVLRRGYTITSINGKILKRSDQAKADEIIDTRFSDGSLRSRVIEKNDA